MTISGKILALISLLLGATLTPGASIPFAEAGKHVGEEMTVTGKVSRVSTIPSGMTFVNFGTRGGEGAFTAVAKPGIADAEKFKGFEGKDVEVTGTIGLYKDSPQIVLKSAEAIRLSGQEPAAPGEEPAATEEPDQPAPAAEFSIAAVEIELDRNEIKAAGKSESGFKPERATIAIALPKDFKPASSQHILAVFPDFSSEAGLEKLITPYAKVASRMGWVVVSAHSPTPDEFAPPGWHAAMTQAAIRHLSGDFPGAEKWGLCLAGSSEGAGRAGLSFGALIKDGYDVRGCFLNSLKREEFGKSIRLFEPSKTKVKRVKVFVSHGAQDTFVPEKQSLEQTEAIKDAGLEDVRHEIHAGRGWMDPAALGTALGWFGEEG
jgi:hypothetical protein